MVSDYISLEATSTNVLYAAGSIMSEKESEIEKIRYICNSCSDEGFFFILSDCPERKEGLSG